MVYGMALTGRTGATCTSGQILLFGGTPQAFVSLRARAPTVSLVARIPALPVYGCPGGVYSKLSSPLQQDPTIPFAANGS